MKSWLYEARTASNLSPEDCAHAMCCSRSTYLNREKAPGTLSLDEISALRTALDERGTRVVGDAIKELIA